jgi:hypothetical protein
MHLLRNIPARGTIPSEQSPRRRDEFLFGEATISSDAAELLDAAVEALGYSASPSLLATVDSPAGIPQDAWSSFGEWLTQGYDAGVDRVFFVKGNPVVVFSKVETQSPELIRRTLDRIWCMARPSLLFLASEGELRVFNLTDRPALHFDQLDDDKRLLGTARSISQVLEKLQQFRRTEVESGKVFEDPRFDERYRADYSLVRDLATVRKRLLKSVPDTEVVNGLIGKAIFIRYLEDREIIDRKYYEEIAQANPKWLAILDAPYLQPPLSHNPKALLPKILTDRDFSFAVFDRLTKDFNGDVFRTTPAERSKVLGPHLDELSKLLLGEADGSTLFFRIYQFDVIPIELVSCIYEEFYKNDLEESDNDDKHGTHYTSTSLVEFLLSSTLRDCDISQKNAKIIDPACGSGIFLVAAFRRFVRERWASQGTRPASTDLIEILGERIAGIDISEPAIVIAAFSLYLALLHYQRPKAIIEQMNRGNTLPNLVMRGHPRDSRHLNILYVGDAFEVASRDQEKAAIRSGSFDIVLGNPPWGIKGTTAATKEWVTAANLSMSRGERSQAFVWLAVHLLKPGGRAGLLLAKSILLSHDKTNTAFREQWNASCRFLEIADFTHVRQIFFSGPDRTSQAIHPFISAVFQVGRTGRSRFLYLSAKRSPLTERLQAPVFSYNDVHRLEQDENCVDYRFWKAYWWGSHRDYQLIRRLDAENQLRDFVPSTKSVDRGYQVGRGYPLVDALHEYMVLRKEDLGRYGRLPKVVLGPPPKAIHARVGNVDLYDGPRLIISRSPRQDAGANGRLIVRFEKGKFCFTDDVLGVRLKDADERSYLVLLGILWSSFARYYLWFTTSMWGTRNDKIHKGELLNFPVRLPAAGSASELRILRIVKKLRDYPFDSPANLSDTSSFAVDRPAAMKRLEKALDECVFDLYELTQADRDLVTDLCKTGLPFFYQGWESPAARPIVPFDHVPKNDSAADINGKDVHQFPILDYVRVFAEQWNQALLPNDGELAYSVLQSPDADGTLVVAFLSQARKRSSALTVGRDADAWKAILRVIDKALLQPLAPGGMYVDGLVRVVSHSYILIIKRNERRLWTRSLARVDAEATWLKAMT